MPEYCNKSFEELGYEDYTKGNFGRGVRSRAKERSRLAVESRTRREAKQMRRRRRAARWCAPPKAAFRVTCSSSSLYGTAAASANTAFSCASPASGFDFGSAHSSAFDAPAAGMSKTCANETASPCAKTASPSDFRSPPTDSLFGAATASKVAKKSASHHEEAASSCALAAQSFVLGSTPSPAFGAHTDGTTQTNATNAALPCGAPVSASPSGSATASEEQASCEAEELAQWNAFAFLDAMVAELVSVTLLAFGVSGGGKERLREIVRGIYGESWPEVLKTATHLCVVNFRKSLDALTTPSVKLTACRSRLRLLHMPYE
mmetsp:Transcript_881/g.1701  ORF Transcript_881/g.1701 Transcript_881/m.1701 type:complete len:319 (+) Transcript_881:525-1481(+)